MRFVAAPTTPKAPASLVVVFRTIPKVAAFLAVVNQLGLESLVAP